MSTYLVAYIVSDFDYKTGDNIENNNVTFRIWARKNALDQVGMLLTKLIIVDTCCESNNLMDGKCLDGP